MAAKLPKGRHRSALKEARKAKNRYLRNRAVKTRIHFLVKEWEIACKEKNQNKAKELLSRIYSLYDKATKWRIIHPNTAARKKSRLSQRFNALFATT